MKQSNLTDAKETVPSSFRDPSGFVFVRNGTTYRQVNVVYKEDYDLLMSSGLYDHLVHSGLLIAHDEDTDPELRNDGCYKIIRPEQVWFISYPYEWSFSQLKDAALTTLRIQQTSLEYGMSLKDASAFNIQFHEGKPVLIDTLSFERYIEGRPWIAYRQFCQHFLAPLALMKYVDIRLSQLLRIYLDGIPLDLASRLLPGRTHFKFSLLSHIHMHAKSQKYFGDKKVRVERKTVSRLALRGLIEGLESCIKRLEWQTKPTEWANYYDDTNYSSDAFACKKELVNQFLSKVKPTSVWDLGSNTGIFSRIASAKGIRTVAFDIDPVAVEKNYRESVMRGETNLLPLLVDLMNPSSDIGWANKERMSLISRGPSDTVLALAVIHHLAISNNVPLARIAELLSGICKTLIVEFVPKEDTQVQKLLATREDIFPHYNRSEFEREFARRFAILDAVRIKDSVRTLYLMERRKD